MSDKLPIEPFLPRILERVQEQDVILSAAPGAGKSTRLLQYLLQTPSELAGKIIVLQPRRVVVRALASFLAAQLNQNVGETVGYRIRGESKVSASTRLEIVTEGVLTRRFQSDPELSGVQMLVFDEFHERNIHSDFSLALAVEAQGALRPDLRLLVMSATLDIEGLQSLLSQAAVIEVPGRQFPIEYEYRPLPTIDRRQQVNKHNTRQEAQHLIKILAEALPKYSGDVLVFLAGVAEIRAAQTALQESQFNHDDNVILSLYGALPKSQQEAALFGDKHQRRKIILATNIAETSLTIDGIRIVIDMGYEKRAKLDLRSGLEQLLTLRISQASAQQRAGRAGRTANGVCYRLWSKEQHARLAQQSPAQIIESDVTEFVLHAKVWGSDLTDLPLIDTPSAGQLAAAHDNLLFLGGVTAEGKLTAHGRALIELPVPVRYAHMLIRLKSLFPQQSSWLHAGVFVISVEEQRHTQSGSLSELLRDFVHQGNKAAEQRMKSLLRRLKVTFDAQLMRSISPAQLALCVALAWPDRIARGISDVKYKLANGKQVALQQQPDTRLPAWICPLTLRINRHNEIQAQLYEPIEESDLAQYFADLFHRSIEWQWDGEQSRWQCLELHYFAQIALAQKALSHGAKNERHQPVKSLSEAWHQHINQRGFAWLPINQKGRQTLQRCRIAAIASAQVEGLAFPGYTESDLIEQLTQWLLPYIENMTTLKQLRELDWHQLFVNRLDYEQQQWLAEHCPTRLALPTGDHARIDYSGLDPTKPLHQQSAKVAVRMQHVFGMAASPMLAGGLLPLSFELLSPAMRPLQTTADLASFWRSNSYVEIKKEMKGRYPKHVWPDDPAQTVATKLTKSRQRQT